MLSIAGEEQPMSQAAKQKEALQNRRLEGYGIMANFLQQAQKNQKKRTRDQISGAQQSGRFMYKFKEGHSKNFKRELNFDYFLS